MTTTPIFEIEVVQKEGQARLICTGEVDMTAEPSLLDTVGSVITEGEIRTLVADVRAVRFIDSSGLRALLKARDMAAAAGLTFRVAVVEGPVLRLFNVAGVSEWFDLV